MLMVAYPEMILLNLLTLIERLDLDFGYALFFSGVRLLWLFNVPCHSDDAIFILSCVFFSFHVLFDDWFEVLAIQGSREMVEGEEILERGCLGRLTKASLGTHLT